MIKIYSNSFTETVQFMRNKWHGVKNGKRKKMCHF